MDQMDFYQAKLNYETDSWDFSESINNGDNVVVIDARAVEAYEYEHIPTAINIPHRTMCPETTMQLDKSKLYVTYCDGIGCNASTKGAMNMVQLGFSVKELLGGLDWWHRDGYETHGNNARVGKKVVCGC
ncbi:MAG: rhodanese-like domain-containing protein [Candidatus Reddybacter sp.]